jgi:perosamine synthetase
MVSVGSGAEDKVAINLGEPSYDDAEFEAIRRVFESNWVAGQGPTSRRFEESFAQFCGASGSIALNNCTAGLHLAFLALGIGRGDEVIVADYTYPATGHSVLYAGATPVFCDVRADTWTIDVAFAETLVTPRTRAIIAVDVAGQPADYDELHAFVNKHGLTLIQDAACSSGATYGGRRTGNPWFADVSLFSFHGRKGITCGEGGAATARDPEVLAQMRKLSCFGVESALVRQGSTSLPIPVFDELGYNYKLSDIACAIMEAQLTKIDDLLDRRRHIARRYESLFSTCELIRTPQVGPNREHAYQTYTLTLDPSVNRDEVAMQLRARGIGCNIGTFASHVQPIYGKQRICPVSADQWNRHLAIPMHANLSDADADEVSLNVLELVTTTRK